MANNIKIVGNIINTSTVERYSEEDIKLISSKRKQELFGGKNDYIEYFAYDAGGNLLNVDYNYLDYKLPPSSFLNPAVPTNPNTTGQIQTTGVGIESTLALTTSSLYPIIEIDPIQDLQDIGYSSGEFTVRYNFFETKISDYISQELFVKEISRDRTEIRLGSTTLSNEQIESGSLDLINKINNTEDYYVDYLLNFGDNQQYVAVNVALNKDPEGYEILFKLYQPLPLEIQEKQTLWVVEEKVIPYNFDINLDKLIIPTPPPTLRGPNFDIKIENQGTVSTAYSNYSTLISNLQSLQSSSYNQIQSLITSQSIDINVDYSDFNNFVFFGSAYQRVINFYNKIKEIEGYQSFITTYTPFVSTTASLQTTINQYSASINNIITEFDGFEYYLYFNSGSSLTSSIEYSITPYPKSGSLLPYNLYSSTSASASVWYGYATSSALEYDLNNKDNLEFAIPAFVKDDENNQPFLLFLNMVGHYFDNIWIYLKAITDINLANNNLDYGISRDLVYQQLKSLGIKLYNSQAGDSVDSYLIGANTGSVLWNNDFSLTSSYLNNIPRKDLVAELYKRIYHNLPLLVKTKGTVAGLNNLMTTFGIPNRTYYTIGSESFYTPTGSAATSSILNVKEFGGSLKSGLVDGYNNDKVRIVDNTLTGSVLSPLLSLQTYSTASSAFRDDDLHYVDISFSPQTQIDTYASGAIASNNPTWTIDDYIGDPGQLYSGSYPDLDAQRKLYFETGVSGFPGFTSSLLDYNGFIRLIEFFDNSLFKMLNDFVPERTSLSTGVTINSPVLERNKVAYSKPTITTQSVHEADYDIADVSSQYGTFYNALSSSNNTKAWYDGNISGSVVDINQYFEDNYNPYLQPSSSIDVNFFNHSDWNVLLNNVSKSVDSQYRKRIEYIYGTTSSITHSAELQDSYLSLKSYNTSRYEGSKTYSKLYNTYTPAQILSGSVTYTKNVPTSPPSAVLAFWAPFGGIEPQPPFVDPNIVGFQNIAVYIDGYGFIDPGNYTFDAGAGSIQFLRSYVSPLPSYITIVSNAVYDGDKSFGKTAAIDKNSLKVGWVKSIPSQSLNFYDKTTVNLKYLVDADNNLTELNKRNYNIFDVQNIFKSGDPAIVSLSDLEKPSYQKTLDGQKNIFRGGFSYDPIIFRENNELLTFRHDTPISQSVEYFGVRAYSINQHNYLTDVGDWVLQNNDPTNLSHAFPFGSEQWKKYYYTRNGGPAIPGIRMSSNKYDITGWRYENLTGFNSTRLKCGTNGYLANDIARVEGWRAYPTVFEFDLLNFTRTDNPGYIRESNTNTYEKTEIQNTIGENIYYFKAPRTSTYKFKANILFACRIYDSYKNRFSGPDTGGGSVLFKVMGIIEKTKTPNVPNSWQFVTSTTLGKIKTENEIGFNSVYSSIIADGDNAYGLFRCYVDGDETLLEENTYVRLQFYLFQYTNIFGIRSSLAGNDNTAGVVSIDFDIGTTFNIENSENTQTFLQIDDVSTSNTIYYYTSTYGQLPALFDRSGSSNDTIIFSESSSYLFTTSSVFFEGTSETRKNYTPVIDPFSIQKYDLLRIGKFEELTATYYEVIDVRDDNSNPSKPRKVAVLNAPITGSLISQNFAILRPKPDETSVILNYKKRLGDVSPTILVPYNLDENTKNNIGDIFKNLNPDLQ